MKKVLVVGVIAIAVGAFLYFQRQSPSKKVTTDDTNNKKNTTEQKHTGLATQAVAETPVDPFKGKSAEELTKILMASIPPSNQLISNFHAADESTLVSAYKAEHDFTKRVGLIWALAGIGGDETVNAFKDTLFDEFKGRKLPENEGQSLNGERAMETIVTCLGFLASRSESAVELLMAGAEPAFWQERATWESPSPEIFNLLAANSIAALGMSGRPEVEEILKKLRDAPPDEVGTAKKFPHGMEGAIVQAAFYLDMVKEKPYPEFYNWLLDRPADIFDADGSYRRWKTSPNGTTWVDWYNKQN